ncbi:phage terminase large subunit [Corallococcus silvisoli]|uniref:phage terminase large subunit n=1 Tax=Corallococcus silvisoli TaxID=2697031 RepID=UPI001378E923|nr:phage terminase large subunit [Corallococcus silvisoli]NBD11821.1 hypothetical protein [Corallococcus silvisoli]
MNSVAYRAPPTLARFMRSNAFVRCCVGPVGSGKSSAACVEVVRRAAEQAAGPDGVRRTRFAVIRNTYRELKDTTRKTFEQWVLPAVGKWHEQDFTFTVDIPLRDGTRMHCEVLFRALDRPEHVKKLLSLELTGAYVNEARQVPKAILDVLCSRVGRYPSKAQGGATWFGVWMDTNPWHTAHWGYKLFSKALPEGYELFEQPGGRAPDAENLENLPPGYYERQVAGKDAEWVAEYIDSKYPSHDKGSIYGDLLAAVEKRGGLLDFPVATDGIFTTWDLGRADSTSIWFWRLRDGGGVDVVDHYRNNGEPLSHYFGVLDGRAASRGYRYRKHVLPHDARAKTLVTRASVLEQVAAKYGPGAVTIGPALSLEDGIAAARALLERDVRFHARCDTPPLPGLESGLEALRSYRYQYNESLQTYSREPLHDWASHDADSFRYLAAFVRVAEALTAASSEAKRPAPPPTEPATFVMPEPWDIAPSGGGSRI